MSEINSEYVDVESDPIFRPVEIPPLSQSPTKSKPAKKTKIRKSYRKKVESEWSQEQILKLIQEIETRRSLWDAGCAEYKLPKEALWQEVADAIHMTINNCKGKWSNLRITFNSNLDKYRKKKSGQGVSESVPITWKYFKPMMFLEANKVLQSTQSTSSMELKSAVDDQTFLLELGKRNTREFVSSSPSTSGQRRKRRITTSTPSPSPSDTSRDSSLKQMTVEALQSIRSTSSQPKNASNALCDYMASELQNLPPEQAAFARSKLRRSFNDIMDDAALISFMEKTTKKENKKSHRDNPLSKAVEHLEFQRKPDESDTLCASWAMRYRKLDSQQQLYANITIEEVLYRAALGRLDENSYKSVEILPANAHSMTSSYGRSQRTPTPHSNFSSLSNFSPSPIDDNSREVKDLFDEIDFS